MMNDLISEFYGGYRFFGYWSSPPKYANQIAVKSRKRVVELASTYNGVYNCGISMCSIIDDVPHLLYLPFDFDAKDLKDAWNDASTLYNELVEDGYDATINYSGYRGFHVIVSVYPKPYTRPQIRVSQKFFAEGLGLKTADKQIFGDIRRLIRIPGTTHAGKFEKTNSHWKRIGCGGICTTIHHTPGELLDLDELVEEVEIDYDELYDNREIKNMPSYTCLERHINNEEPPQIIRYSYVAMLIDKGYEVDDIMNILSTAHSPSGKAPWNDWDEDYTRKQVMHIAYANEYHPLSCQSLKELGYCVKDCPDNIDYWKFKKSKEV
jgi:hypothetical protein